MIRIMTTERNVKKITNWKLMKYEKCKINFNFHGILSDLNIANQSNPRHNIKYT